MMGLWRESPVLAGVWAGWGRVGLPDAWVVAGALAQTVWNGRFGLPAGHGIADVDIVYFDPDDLTEAGEARQAARLWDCLDVPVWLDVKNEARVHLWYEAKFGYPLRPYRSSRDAIDSFPTTATTLGVRPLGEGFEVYAPLGLQDLQEGVVRANKAQILQAVYEAKVARWRAVWPGLRVVAW